MITISASRGSSTSTSLRLCSRAPEMTMRSEAATYGDSTQTNRCSPRNPATSAFPKPHYPSESGRAALTSPLCAVCARNHEVPELRARSPCSATGPPPGSGGLPRDGGKRLRSPPLLLEKPATRSSCTTRKHSKMRDRSTYRGVARLREAVEIYRVKAFTRSLLERRFLSLVRRAGLRRPSMNLFISGFELDAYWPIERFAVELDTYDHH